MIGLTSRLLLLASWLALGAAVHADAAGSDTLAGEARALTAAAATAAGEQRLNEIVLELSAWRGDPAARVLLEELALREPQVYVRHDEGNALIPLVDVGAAARATLRYWDRLAAFDRATQMVRATQPDFVAQYLSANDDARRGMLDAVTRMEPASLLAYYDDIRRAATQPAGDALAATAAIALSDTQLAALVIGHGADDVVQALVARIPSAYTEAAALGLLQAALDRHTVASMALFQIGTLQLKPATDAVWAALHDAELGATAAAILARRGDRDTTRRLVELMRSARTPLTRQRARLALSLSADPAAQAEAHASEASP